MTYLIEGNFHQSATVVDFRLTIINFKDEQGIHFMYSPHLDITGYGYSDEEAQKSFEIVINDFFDYTLKKNTLGKELKELGWSVKGSMKKPKKLSAPSFSDLMIKSKVTIQRCRGLFGKFLVYRIKNKDFWIFGFMDFSMLTD